MKPSTLTVIIPTYNGHDRVRACLESLKAQTLPPDAIIVVDDASTDRTAAMVARKFPQVQVIALSFNRGFCHAINKGLEAAATDAVMTLNNDMTLAPDCLERLMEQWNSQRIVGPLVVLDNDPDLVYAAGDRLLTNGRPESIGFRRPLAEMPFPDRIAGITAGAAIYPRALLERIGYFDERFVAYFDDMDVALRLRWRGAEPVLVPAAVVRHEGAASLHDRPWWRTRQCGRNHPMLVLKHWPLGLLFRHAPSIAMEVVAGMRRTFDAIRCERGAAHAALAVAGVWVEWWLLIPHALYARRRIARMRSVSKTAFADWLSAPGSTP